MNRILTYTIEKTYHGVSVETFLRKVPALTKSQIRSLKFRPEGITVNGQKVRTTAILKEGDCLALQLQPENAPSSGHILPLDLPLDILYEDADLLVINKPAGILVHPSGIHYQDTLSNMVSAYFRSKGESAPICPIGRLDKDTSGTVIFAKNKFAAAFLSDRKQSRLGKEYLAIVSGVPSPARGEITVPIRPCSQSPLKMTVDPIDGKNACTRFQTQAVLKNGNALIRLCLLTGRTHQIRVHMAHMGHPLIGDPLYGKGDEIFHRAALHADRAHFLLPFTRKEYSAAAPLPEDFRKYLSEWTK